MALGDDLKKEVKAIIRGGWTTRDGKKVPEPEDLKLGNDGIDLNATILYADLDGSTDLVDKFDKPFAAEVYKSYLLCAARITKEEGGTITAYDGDRVMAIFIGDSKNTQAARAALKINWSIINIVNAEIAEFYAKPEGDYKARHRIGIDTSTIMAARIGVRTDNDIVWVGRAANYAAKLTAINHSDAVFITGDVYDYLHSTAKFGGSPQRNMWTERKWTAKDDRRIFSSDWTWTV